MAWLRKPAGRKPSDAAQDFWAWWSTAHDEMAQMVDGADPSRALAELAARLERVDPRLTLSLVPGRRARRAVVASGGGDPEARATAERWVRCGPAADEVWEYLPARPPNPAALSGELTVGDRTVDVARTVVAARADDATCRLDLAVHHPAFPDLPHQARIQVAALVLDWALGEDDVQRWVGPVRTLEVPPLDPVPASGLTPLVGQLRERWGGQRWAVLEGLDNRGRPVAAAVRHPLHQVDYPLFDLHLAVVLPFTGGHESGPSAGLPDEVEQGDLQAFQLNLLDHLDGMVVPVAQETAGGRRVLHLYGESTGPAAARIEALLGGYRCGTAALIATPDPRWEAITHLRPTS